MSVGVWLIQPQPLFVIAGRFILNAQPQLYNISITLLPANFLPTDAEAQHTFAAESQVSPSTLNLEQAITMSSLSQSATARLTLLLIRHAHPA